MLSNWELIGHTCVHFQTDSLTTSLSSTVPLHMVRPPTVPSPPGWRHMEGGGPHRAVTTAAPPFLGDTASLAALRVHAPLRRGGE